MSHITNHHALSQELNLAYDKAIQRFPDRADEIDDVFEAANELHMSLRVIDKCIDTMELKWAAETGSKLMSLGHRLFSLSTHSKALFTWRDAPVSWRRAPTNNIVYAIENEASAYMWQFDCFLFRDGTSDDEEALSSLRSEIRQRAAKDDNAESDVVGRKPKHVGTASGPSGQLRNNVPQPTEVSEFYRLQQLTTWQGKSKAEIHREIARRNAKKTKRTLTEAQLMKEAERIKKAIRDYERKVNQQQ